MSSPDERCDLLRGATDDDIEELSVQVACIDGERADRLTLAILRGDDESADRVLAEVEQCPLCYRGLARFLAHSLANTLEEVAGNTAAIVGVEERLTQNMEHRL